MIEAERDALSGHYRIVLLPNASLSKRQAGFLLAALAAAMSSIAAFFAAMGAWLVFPFSGAEWMLLACCFRIVLQRTAMREVITITDAEVRVEREYRKRAKVQQLKRHWVNVERVRSLIPGQASHVYLRLHGKRLEVGDFLVESERERLAGDLRKILVDSRSL